MCLCVQTSDAERIGVDQVAKLTASGQASGSEQLTSHFTALHSAIKMLSQRVRVVAVLMEKMQTGACVCVCVCLCTMKRMYLLSAVRIVCVHIALCTHSVHICLCVSAQCTPLRPSPVGIHRLLFNASGCHP